MQAFADIVRQGKALYIGVSEWTAEQLREGHALAKQLGFQLVSNQPQYSALWRVIEGKVVPTSEELGISQIVWSPMAQGVLSGQVPAGSACSRRLARDRREERRRLHQALPATTTCSTAVQRLKPIAEQAGLTMPQLAIAWVLQNKNVSAALVGASRPEQLADRRRGLGRDARRRHARRDRRRRSAASSSDDPEETYEVSPKSRLAEPSPDGERP